MRMLIAAALLAASSLTAAAPAAADTPARLPELGTGEVLLEVNSVGIARSPATSARLTVTVTGNGVTEAEARQVLAATVARVTAAARAAGAAEADIEVTPQGGGEMADLRSFDVGEEGEDSAGAAAQEPRFYGTSRVEIRLRNPAGAADLHRALADIGGANASSPEYELDDDSVPRRAARADAVRRARADAEAYAAALGMRIVRVLRVTERTGLDSMGMMLTESNLVMREMRAFNPSGSDPEVETYALAGVDFVLGPR